MKNLYLICFLLTFALLPLLAQPFDIGETTITFTDPARSNRAIATNIYYPADVAGTGVAVANGEFPIVVFGHGFTIDATSYSNIWEVLVPEGYIVAFPTTEGGLGPNHANFGADIAFVADAMVAEGSNQTSLFLNATTDKVAIMGHSMGGGAAFLAAENNANITTLITLAAAETTTSAIGAAANISVPNLVIAGEKDCVTPVADHQIPMYNNLASACKIYYEIDGAAHCNFTDGSAALCFLAEGFTCLGWGPFISSADQHTAVDAALLPWLAFWLQNNCDAWFSDFQPHISSGTGFTTMSPDLTCGIVAPIAHAGTDVVICNGESTPLAATGGVTYQWSPTADLDNAAIANPVASPISTTTYTVIVTDANGCTAMDEVVVTVDNCSVLIELIVFLEGAYNAATGLMNTTLQNDNLVPLQQPYDRLPWNYQGGESVASVGADVVDWVLVEIRDAADNTTLITSKAALLKEDGQIVDIDGVSSGLVFDNLTPNTSYYIAVRHRNHLAVISENPVLVPTVATFSYADPANVSGGTVQLADLGGGLYGLLAGDFDSNGTLSVTDFNLYTSQTSLLNVYVDGDVSLDKTVTVADFNLYLPNSSVIGASVIRY